MNRIFLAFALLALALAGSASAQMGVTFFPGPGMPASTGGACGTGVIDLSTGCSLPIALGLVP